MQRVLKKIFFIDEKTENSLKFWVLLGPYCLFFSIILAPFELAVLAAVSAFLCYRFRFKGLVLSLIALTAYSFYTQVNLTQDHLWNLGLEISIALSLIITAFGLDEIKNLLSNKSENPQDLLNLQQQINENQKAFENAEKNYQDNINQLSNELDVKAKKSKQIYLENENLKKDLIENTQRKDYLLNELDQKVKEKEDLQVKLDELYEKISFLKDEEFLLEKNKTYLLEIEELKAHGASQSQEKEKITLELKENEQKIVVLENKLSDLEKDHEKATQNINNEENEKIILELNAKKQKITTLENKLSDFEKNNTNIEALHKKLKDTQTQLKTLKQTKNQSPLHNDNITDKELLKEYDNKNKELSKLNSLYVQLKDQFNEKQEVLHKTRQNLFQAQENITAFKKDLSNDFKDLSDNEKSLMKDLDKTESELKVYKQENLNLQDLVGKLLEKSSLKKEDDISENEISDQKELF